MITIVYFKLDRIANDELLTDNVVLVLCLGIEQSYVIFSAIPK